MRRLYRPPQPFWHLLTGSIAKRLTSSPKMPLHLFVWAITPLTVWYLEGAIYIQETASAEWDLTIKACIPPVRARAARKGTPVPEAS